MINPFEQINWQPKDKDIKSFGKSMIIGFACIAAIFFLVQIFRTPFNKAIVMPLCLLGFGVLMFLLTRIVPKLTLPVYYVWFFVSACIGIVVSNVILMIFFYLIFTPFAIGLKLATGRDPLQLKRKADAKTYWLDCKKNKDQSRYLKQY